MLYSTAGQRTLKSPRSELHRLTAEVLQREHVLRCDREDMYRLLEMYFDNTSWQQFEQDLAEKELVILLRDESHRVAGFSTLMKLPVAIEGTHVVGFFSGDTIIAREHWGSSLLGRIWLRTVFSEAEQIRKTSPEMLVYWFLISSGYKTWRYLPVFFADYSPNPQWSGSPFDRTVLRTLAAKKFGDEYHPDAGIVRFRRANPLRPGVAEVTEQRLRDPLVDFFVRMNPGHARGDELACLARISRSNLTRAGLRWLQTGGRA